VINPLEKISKSSVIYYSLFGFLFWHLAKEMLKVTSSGWYVGQVNLYGDLVYHLALINKFLNTSSIVIDSPILAGSKVNYPIFADYITSQVARLTGIDFALFITTLGGGLIVLITSKLFIKSFIKNNVVAFLAVLLFFLNGGFGFYYFFHDFSLSQKAPIDFLLSLPREYTDLKDLGYWWINSLLAYFIPQRGFLFAFPITITVLLLLYRGYQKNKTTYFLLAGILAGSLPIVQAHSLLLIFILSLMYFPLSLYRNKNVIKLTANWMLFALLTATISLPLFKIISSVSSPFEFIRFDPGWTSKENIFWFWLKNLGLFGPILIMSIIWLFKNTKLFMLYIPFLIIFIISNIWIFQPWEFDNSKLLIYWYFASCIVVAYFIYYTLFTGHLIKKIIGLVLVMLLTLSGGLDLFRTFTPVTSYQIYTKQDLEIASLVKLLTPADAVFVTASNHNHPIPTLTGRSTIIGFHGWVWSHGENYLQRVDDVATIYLGGENAEEIIRNYKVHYVTVGPQEIQNFSINLSYYHSYPQINIGNGWTLYDVSTLWADRNRQN